MSDPPWARVVVYPATEDHARAAVQSAAAADVVVKASGVGVFDAALEDAVAALRSPRRTTVFWDVDAAATLERIAHDQHDGRRALVPDFDLVLTYGGGAPVSARRPAPGCCASTRTRIARSWSKPCSRAATWRDGSSRRDAAPAQAGHPRAVGAGPGRLAVDPTAQLFRQSQLGDFTCRVRRLLTTTSWRTRSSRRRRAPRQPDPNADQPSDSIDPDLSRRFRMRTPAPADRTRAASRACCRARR